MRVIIRTLVDITPSGARRGADQILVNQQANYNTVINTIGLRINPEILSVEELAGDMGALGFGKLYDSKHRFWKLEFNFSYEGGLSEEMLQDDFDLVPFIKGLTETASLPNSVFRTKDPAETNITFEFIEY